MSYCARYARGMELCSVQCDECANPEAAMKCPICESAEQACLDPMAAVTCKNAWDRSSSSNNEGPCRTCNGTGGVMGDAPGLVTACNACDGTGKSRSEKLQKADPLATLLACINMTDGHVQEMLRHAYDGLHRAPGRLPTSYYKTCPVCDAPQSATQRSAWQQGIEDGINYLRGSTFSAQPVAVQTLDACVALLRSLKANPLWGPGAPVSSTASKEGKDG